MMPVRNEGSGSGESIDLHAVHAMDRYHFQNQTTDYWAVTNVEQGQTIYVSNKVLVVTDELT